MSVTQSPAWTSRSATIVAPKRRQDVVEEMLDGQCILCDPKSGDTYRLNETAVWVWHLCDGARSIRDIARQLTDHYEVDLDVALDHTEELVAFFATSMLLEAMALD